MKHQRPTSTKVGHTTISIRELLSQLSQLRRFAVHKKFQKAPLHRHALSNAQYHLSSSEVRGVIASGATPRDQVLIRVFAETGIRRFELANLLIEDLRFAEGQIVIRAGKGNKSRVIPMASTLRSHLIGLVGAQRSGSVFQSKSGCALSVRQINRIVAFAGHRARVSNPNPKHSQLTCHLFRHTFARLWKAKNGSIETLARILGHTRPSTTWSLYGTESLQDMQRNYSQTIKRMFPDGAECTSQGTE